MIGSPHQDKTAPTLTDGTASMKIAIAGFCPDAAMDRGFAAFAAVANDFVSCKGAPSLHTRAP